MNNITVTQGDPVGVLMRDEEIEATFARGRMVDPATGVNGFNHSTTGPGMISYGLSSAGYDFTLGAAAKVFVGHRSKVIDPLAFDPKNLADLELETEDRNFPTGENTLPVFRKLKFFTIPANSKILSETVEYIDIPRDVMIVVVGKSTYARSGIIVNVTPLEPGWRGKVTIEIANVTPCPARVYVGMGIFQALFFRLSAPARHCYGDRSGRYQDQKGLTLPTTE